MADAHPGTVASEPAGPARLSLGRDFRVLWAAQSTSLFGSSLMVIALPWEAFSLTRSVTSTAFVSAALIAPYPVLGIVSGVVADRLDRRRTMVVADVARAVVSGGLTLAIGPHALRLWMLLAGTVLLGAFSTIFDAAYASFTPQVVHPDLLNSANGRMEASNAASNVAGPQAGGVLIAATGTVAAFGIDALSYVVGAIGSFLVRYRKTAGKSATPSGVGGAVSMAREGLTYLIRSAILRRLTISAAALAIANGALDGLLVPLLRVRLHYGEVASGAMFSAGAVGWFSASVLATRTKSADQLPFSSLVAIFAAAAGSVGLGTGHNIPVIGAALFLFQGGIFYFLITVITLRQRIVPSNILGRVHALARSLANVGTPLGAMAGGVLASRFSIGLTVTLMCGIPLVVSLSLSCASAGGS